ncbi:MAG: hypothetical protein PWQ55_915 [Chloroflexota bacterium]|nr:hypothetical protein [Chloroflexota bacterium]
MSNNSREFFNSGDASLYLIVYERDEKKNSRPRIERGLLLCSVRNAYALRTHAAQRRTLTTISPNPAANQPQL